MSRFFRVGDSESPADAPPPSNDAPAPPPPADSPATEPAGAPDPPHEDEPADAPPPLRTEPVATPQTLPDVGLPALFAEDFGGLSAGDFPASLVYKRGAMMTDTREGRPALRISGEGWFQIRLPDDLPETFTIAFDYHNPNRQSHLYVAPLSPSARREPGRGRYRVTTQHYAVVSQESDGVGFDSRGDGLPSATAANAAFVDRMVPVLIRVDGRRGRVLVDGEPVATLPAVDMARSRTIDVYLWARDGQEAWIADLEVRGE